MLYFDFFTSSVYNIIRRDTMQVKVGVSNRHVHLSKDDFNVLFGCGMDLPCDFMLGQPGEFASSCKVVIKGPKGEIANVRVMGPFRSYTQVEVCRTDCFTLGITAPIRDSGDILNSSPITIVGPKGFVDKKYGCIIARRHIHLNEADRVLFGVAKKIVRIKVSNAKGGILDNVYLKYGPNFKLECHLDTDDANGNLLASGDFVTIVD